MIPFASRISHVQKSFIREILKVTQNPEVISFAGGLPNPAYFPVEEIAVATDRAMQKHGRQMLQYSPTLGYAPLREQIATRYQQVYDLAIDANDILIVNGSQQALDLIGKIMLDEGDKVLLEAPSYLGAVQSLSLFQPQFVTAPLTDEGIDTAVFQAQLQTHRPKLFYAVTTFQNPTGISYSDTTRRDVARLLNETNTLYIEDNPYAELRFSGKPLPPLRAYGAENGFLMGSFSKIVAPGMRLGWIVARPELMDKLITVKQAADLHSNQFTQQVLSQYLLDNDLDVHIAKIRHAYATSRDLMLAQMAEHFPAEVRYTQPEGGMFIWVTLPEGVSSMTLFEEAVKQNVVFVPGKPFFVDGSGDNTFRLNFSTPTADQVRDGIQRLGAAIKTALLS